MTFVAKGRPLKRPALSTGESMKLQWSPRSPFVRKVMVAAHELGLAGKIECVRSVAAMGKPNPAIMLDNPLSKIPALVQIGRASCRERVNVWVVTGTVEER